MHLNIDYSSCLSKAKNFRQRFLILHYTAKDFQGSIASLTGPHVSVHYLVPTLQDIDPTYPHDSLKVYALVPEAERAWHAGDSQWGNRAELNDSSIGIEIVNLTTDVQFQPYPDKQIELVISLCQNILQRYPDITPNNVIGHSDISVGRKIDPGPMFPWFKLYQHGVGAWFDEVTVQEYTKQFTAKMPSKEDVISKLKDYGYNINVEDSLLFKAFQMHFRPANYFGLLDVETAAIAYALCDKYV